ncbi:MAG TPA: hypothetical protein VJ890_17685 [Vineibacter sp.]|nr:hypothetical protein [Vineibacter sp.]
MAAMTFLMSVEAVPGSSVRVEVDWGRRSWSANSGQWGWGRRPMPTNGPVRTQNGALWLMEPNGPGYVVAIDKAPTGPSDIANMSGSGKLCDVYDRNWPTTRLNWSRESAAGASAATGNAQVRDEAEAVCRANLPPEFQLQEPVNCCVAEKGKVKTPGGATGCGQFPGWVIARIKGAKFIQDKVMIAKGTQWQSTPGVTSDTIGWEEMAQQLEKVRKWPPGTLWRAYDPAKSDIRPRKGDIYLLKQSPAKNAMFGHVGVMIDSSGTTWKTADGGQGKGFAVGFRRRTFDPASAKITGEEGTMYYLKGWVDLEGLLER